MNIIYWLTLLWSLFTAWKVSKYGAFSVPNSGKYEPEKTPYLVTFHAVIVFMVITWLRQMLTRCQSHNKKPDKHLWWSFLVIYDKKKQAWRAYLDSKCSEKHKRETCPERPRGVFQKVPVCILLLLSWRFTETVLSKIRFICSYFSMTLFTI